MISSERIKKIQTALPKSVIKTATELCEMSLPYLDESEAYAFWLIVRDAYTNGKADQVSQDLKTINKAIYGGAQ